MAEKKSFVIYQDYKSKVFMLSDEQAGKVFKSLFEFNETKNVPELADGMSEMLLKFITDNMARDEIKYKDTCERRRKAVKKRWDNIQSSQSDKDTNVYNSSFCNTNDTIHTDTDTVNVTDNDNDIDTVNDTVTVTVNDNDSDGVNDIVNEIVHDIVKANETKQPSKQTSNQTAKAEISRQKSEYDKYGRNGNVTLTKEEYSELVRSYGKSVTDDYISRLDRYSEMHAKTYRDCKRIILSWLDKDGVKKSDIGDYKAFINVFPEL